MSSSAAPLQPENQSSCASALPLRFLPPQGVGAEALALGSGKTDVDADDDVDDGKHAQFAAGAAVDVDGEDPNMFPSEQELAKRRGAGGDGGGGGAGTSGGGAKSAEERLWDTRTSSG